MEIGLVEYHVVVGVRPRLALRREWSRHGVEHYVERAKVNVALVAEGQNDDKDGREKFDSEYGDYKSKGDGAGLDEELHWPWSFIDLL